MLALFKQPNLLSVFTRYYYKLLCPQNYPDKATDNNLDAVLLK
jgi:hypothetical protein